MPAKIWWLPHFILNPITKKTFDIESSVKIEHSDDVFIYVIRIKKRTFKVSYMR